MCEPNLATGSSRGHADVPIRPRIQASPRGPVEEPGGRGGGGGEALATKAADSNDNVLHCKEAVPTQRVRVQDRSSINQYHISRMIDTFSVVDCLAVGEPDRYKGRCCNGKRLRCAHTPENRARKSRCHGNRGLNSATKRNVHLFK